MFRTRTVPSSAPQTSVLPLSHAGLVQHDTFLRPDFIIFFLEKNNITQLQTQLRWLGWESTEETWKIALYIYITRTFLFCKTRT